MRLSEKINLWLHEPMTDYVRLAYARKSRRVEKKHPELFRPVDPELSRRHRELWGRTGLACGDRWLRLHVNLTGIEDHTFCPEDIFFARIERVMNCCDQSGYGPEDKLNLFRYVPAGCEPETVLRFSRGSFFDGKGNWVDRMAADRLLEGEFVIKPCRSSGGNGVQLRSGLTADEVAGLGGEAFVVQRRIEQGEFTAQFNRASINTVRMMTMRCPWNGEIVVCRSMLRMGVSDAVVDNMMKGGLCVCIGDRGQLGTYAYDYDGRRFERHPVSGLRFSGLTHPGYDKLVETAKAVHRNVPDFNLLSFDLVQRKDGSVCVVEINATSQGVTQLQYDFGGLFGAQTERVVDWVAQHLQYDRFSHVRTWY